MRDLQECKAEVFRRMETGIKRKKKRQQRILTFCIPFFICAVMYAVLIVPAMMPAGESANENNMGQYATDKTEAENYIGNSVQNSTLKKPSVLITDKNSSKKYSQIFDEKEVSSLLNTLNDLLNTKNQQSESIAENTEQNADENFNPGGNNNTGITESTGTGISGTEGSIYDPSNPDITATSPTVISYRFDFTNSAGKNTVFTLTGNLLTDENTKKSKLLSEKELSEITQFLENYITWEDRIK